MPPSSANGLTPFRNAQGMKPPVLNIVRFAMLGGVLFFAAIAWFLTSSGQMGAAGNDELAGVLRYVFYGLLVVDLGALWLVRQRIDRAETFEKKGPLLLIGYALGEGLALYGIVYWLVTGGMLLFFVGLLVFLAAFLVFPVQPASGGA